MAKIERFEDLTCWQEARELTRAVYRLVADGKLARDFRLRDQLTAAAVSVMTNIAEGFARYHRGDFIRFLDYAQSSAAEVKSLLYVVLDQQYADAVVVTDIQRQAETCQRMTLGLLRHVRRTMREDGGAVGEPSAVYSSPPSGWDLPISHINPSRPSKRPETRSTNEAPSTPQHLNTSTP